MLLRSSVVRAQVNRRARAAGPARPRASLRRCGQRPQPDHFVGGGGTGHGPVDALAAPVPLLAEQPDGLQPAKALLDQLPLLLTDRVARMPGRAASNRAVSLLRRDVRREALVAQPVHIPPGVVVLVAAHGAAVTVSSQDRHRVPFGGPGGGDARVDDQAVAMVEQGMREIAQHGARAALPKQLRVRTGRRAMGAIRSAFAVDLHGRIPGIVGAAAAPGPSAESA